MRLNVSARLILFAAALTVLSVGLTFWFVHRAAQEELANALGAELRVLAQTSSSLIDVESLASHSNSEQERQLAKKAVEHIRLSLPGGLGQRSSQARANRVYLVQPIDRTQKSGEWGFHRLPILAGPVMPKATRHHTADTRPYQRTAVREGSTTSDLYSDAAGLWLSAASPLIDRQGQVVGLLQIDRSIALLQFPGPEQTWALWQAMAASLAMGALLSITLSRSLVGRLRLMADAVLALGRGDLERRLSISSGDEIGDLADGINQMATDLQEAQEKARDATCAVVTSGRLAAVGQMAAGIAHEINNPLTWVRANLALLGEHCAELRDQIKARSIEPGAQAVAEESSEMISEALEGVDRALDIVQDIKGFAHAGSGRQEATDLIQVLEQVLRVASPQTRGIEVRQAFNPIPTIRAETQALKQVFLNLIVNASQAVGPGGTIEIRTDRVADHVVASVSDNGPGIRPEDRPRLFDPFFTTKPVGQGTGLGLSICFEIIRRHGGIIHVEPGPDRGASFEVHLPVNDPDHDGPLA